jgi:hypothetical protein
MKKSARLQDLEEVFASSTEQNVLEVSFSATRKYKIKVVGNLKSESSDIANDYTVVITGNSEVVGALASDLRRLSHNEFVGLAVSQKWVSDDKCYEHIRLKHGIYAIYKVEKLFAWTITDIKVNIISRERKLLETQVTDYRTLSF